MSNTDMTESETPERREARFGEIRQLIKRKARESDVWHALDKELGEAKTFLAMIEARRVEASTLERDLSKLRGQMTEARGLLAVEHDKAKAIRTDASEHLAKAKADAAAIVSAAEAEAAETRDKAAVDARRIVCEAETEAAEVRSAIARIRGVA